MPPKSPTKKKRKGNREIWALPQYRAVLKDFLPEFAEASNDEERMVVVGEAVPEVAAKAKENSSVITDLEDKCFDWLANHVKDLIKTGGLEPEGPDGEVEDDGEGEDDGRKPKRREKRGPLIWTKSRVATFLYKEEHKQIWATVDKTGKSFGKIAKEVRDELLKRHPDEIDDFMELARTWNNGGLPEDRKEFVTVAKMGQLCKEFAKKAMNRYKANIIILYTCPLEKPDPEKSGAVDHNIYDPDHVVSHWMDGKGTQWLADVQSATEDLYKEAVDGCKNVADEGEKGREDWMEIVEKDGYPQLPQIPDGVTGVKLRMVIRDYSNKVYELNTKKPRTPWRKIAEDNEQYIDPESRPMRDGEFCRVVDPGSMSVSELNRFARHLLKKQDADGKGLVFINECGPSNKTQPRIPTTPRPDYLELDNLDEVMKDPEDNAASDVENGHGVAVKKTRTQKSGTRGKKRRWDPGEAEKSNVKKAAKSKVPPPLVSVEEGSPLFIIQQSGDRLAYLRSLLPFARLPAYDKMLFMLQNHPGTLADAMSIAPSTPSYGQWSYSLAYLPPAFHVPEHMSDKSVDSLAHLVSWIEGNPHLETGDLNVFKLESALLALGSAGRDIHRAVFSDPDEVESLPPHLQQSFLTVVDWETLVATANGMLMSTRPKEFASSTNALPLEHAIAQDQDPSAVLPAEIASDGGSVPGAKDASSTSECAPKGSAASSKPKKMFFKQTDVPSSIRQEAIELGITSMDTWAALSKDLKLRSQYKSLTVLWAALEGRFIELGKVVEDEEVYPFAILPSDFPQPFIDWNESVKRSNGGPCVALELVNDVEFHQLLEAWWQKNRPQQVPEPKGDWGRTGMSRGAMKEYLAKQGWAAASGQGLMAVISAFTYWSLGVAGGDKSASCASALKELGWTITQVRTSLSY